MFWFILIMGLIIFLGYKSHKASIQANTQIIRAIMCPPHKWRPFVDNQFFEDKNIGDMPEHACLRCMKCGVYPSVE